MRSSPERLLFAAGQVIYQAGEQADGAYLVLSGGVALASMGPDGRPRTVLRRCGDIIGDLALVEDGVRDATATSSEDCELLMFSSLHLVERMADVDPLVQLAFVSMATRYSETAERWGGGTPAAAPTARMRTVWSAQAQVARDLLSFEHQIRAGLERGEFEVFFQPIVQIDTGRLAGVEALTRWRHPRRGLLMPVDFISFAESCGAISALTNEGMRRMGTAFPILQAAAARSANGGPLFVGINVSSLDLEQECFAAMMAATLCDAGVDPADVKLEVTESILMADAERCAQTLRNCRDQGFAIAIDDFGAGYSSLNYLGMLPITDLKLDRSFCRSLLTEAAGAKIIEAILHLGQDLGLTVTAEGIETVEQFDRLKGMGCRLGQGYLFGPAITQDDMLALIADWPTLWRNFSPRPAA